MWTVSRLCVSTVSQPRVNRQGMSLTSGPRQGWQPRSVGQCQLLCTAPHVLTTLLQIPALIITVICWHHCAEFRCAPLCCAQSCCVQLRCAELCQVYVCYFPILLCLFPLHSVLPVILLCSVLLRPLCCMVTPAGAGR